MAKYLYMDGVDDTLRFPVMTFDRMEAELLVMEKSGMNVIADMYVNGKSLFGLVYMDGQFAGQGFSHNLIIGQRGQVESTVGLTTAQLYLMNGAFGFGKGEIYRVTFYNGASVVADYDMSTGTVQDQSGSGRHATLVGGTWLGEDTEPSEPTGSPQTFEYVTKQIHYGVTSTSRTTRQDLYEPHQFDNGTKQRMNENVVTQYASHLTIYENTTHEFESRQQLFEEFSSEGRTRQTLYKQTIQNYKSNQQLFENLETYGITRQTIFKEIVFDIGTLQEYFNEGAVFKATYVLKTVISKGFLEKYVLSQQVSKVVEEQGSLNQTIFSNENISNSLKQVITKELEHKASLIQRINQEEIYDYSTLQNLFEDWNNYTQSITYILQIAQHSSFVLEITQSTSSVLEVTKRSSFELEIEQQSSIDLEIVSELNSDLNI